MNMGEGDAAEKVVRMMLSGGEVAVRLTGSALKNGAALLLALYRNHRKVYGKTNFVKLLNQTRDVRTFPMTLEQFRMFQKDAGKHKILYAAVQDTRRRNALVDLMLPATEIERANRLFEKIRYAPQEPEQAGQHGDPVKKKNLGRNPAQAIQGTTPLRATTGQEGRRISHPSGESSGASRRNRKNSRLRPEQRPNPSRKAR